MCLLYVDGTALNVAPMGDGIQNFGWKALAKRWVYGRDASVTAFCHMLGLATVNRKGGVSSG